jgi:hypothetical protein
MLLSGTPKRVEFLSNGGTYAVKCPAENAEETRAYVHAVESAVPALQQVFSPLKPSFGRYDVTFGDKGPLYGGGGAIFMNRDMDLQSEAERYGGLFHETVHGFVEGYIHRPGGTNVHPLEALAIILQVAALYKVNTHWASKYRNGYGSNAAVHPWLNELGRIYDEAGVEPIRAVYEEMGGSPSRIFRDKATYVIGPGKRARKTGHH